VTDNHYLAAGPLERVEGGLSAFLEPRPRIAVRHIGRHRFMTPRAQSRDQSRPARSVMPIAVKEAEGRHAPQVYHPQSRTEPSDREFPPPQMAVLARGERPPGAKARPRSMEPARR
jgi:hypothetical protein